MCNLLSIPAQDCREHETSKQHDLSSANLLIEQVQLLFHAGITGITLEHDVYPI